MDGLRVKGMSDIEKKCDIQSVKDRDRRENGST